MTEYSVEGKCVNCGAPTDPDYGHVGNCRPAPPAQAAQVDVARFGHHPDPATDFCVEVEALLGEIENHRIGFENGTPTRAELDARIERALSFRVGGDPHAVMAKQQLRAATIAEPAAQGEVVAYFSADPAEGEFSTHKSLAEAIAGAESLLAFAQDVASDDGWADEPPQICYGVVFGGCAETEGSRKPAPEGSDFTYVVDFHLTTPAAQPRALPAERVVDGIAVAAEYIQKKADAYAEENCGTEWDTGATTYHFGQAGEDYHHTLLELAEEVAALASLTAAPQPGESNNKPADCSGDPLSCPDNEGRGCYCGDLRRAGESA